MRPENGEGPTVGAVAPRDHTSEHGAIVQQQPDEGKAFATLAAQLALHGYALHELSCGGFLIGRHDTTAHCSDLHEVARFLRQIGGAQ